MIAIASHETRMKRLCYMLREMRDDPYLHYTNISFGIIPAVFMLQETRQEFIESE